MKKHYYAVQTRQGELYAAQVVAAPSSSNLVSVFASIPGLVAACPCSGRQEADWIVRSWIDCFRRSGVYLFDTMPDGSPAPF